MKLLPLLFLLSLSAFAQEDKKVMLPITRLFEAMKKGDSAMVRKSFRPHPTFYTVMPDTKTNEPTLRVDGFADFLVAVGRPHKEVFEEIIWSPKVEIDGNFAQVWSPYFFYMDKTFHHCGVDAFHLFKDATGEWKIFNLSDTRQKVGCKIPKEISDKMK